MIEEAYKWKKNGHIFLWSFLFNTKNFPGYHMSFDEQGRESFIMLLRKLKKSSVRIDRTVELSHPTVDVLMVPNNGQDISTRRSVKIIFDEINIPNFGAGSDNYELRANSLLLSELEERLMSVQSGRESSLKIGEHILNFWW